MLDLSEATALDTCASSLQHTHGFRILSAILLISEILAANILKYAAHAIRKDRDNGKYATHANSKVWGVLRWVCFAHHTIYWEIFARLSF